MHDVILDKGLLNSLLQIQDRTQGEGGAAGGRLPPTPSQLEISLKFRVILALFRQTCPPLITKSETYTSVCIENLIKTPIFRSRLRREH